MKLNKKSLKNTLYAAGFGVLGIANTYGQTPMKTMEVRGAPKQYVVADFNNDNIDDIASISLNTRNYIQQTSIKLQLNKLNVRNQTTKTVGTLNKEIYGEGIHLLAGDFNGDGDQDLYLSVIYKTGKQAEYYFQGDGKGNFTNKTSFN